MEGDKRSRGGVTDAERTSGACYSSSASLYPGKGLNVRRSGAYFQPSGR